jgi:hypothetical protein
MVEIKRFKLIAKRTQSHSPVSKARGRKKADNNRVKGAFPTVHQMAGCNGDYDSDFVILPDRS